MASNLTKDILKRTEGMLKFAMLGLQDLIYGPPERKLAGLSNLIVFGRAVTNVLQNLRSTETDFDKWYEKYKNEMKSDPLMKYFYNLRSEILKEGILKTSTQLFIKRLQIPGDLNRFGPPPPNAKGFFIGDNIGGSGWEVQLPDGSIDKYYVRLPYDIGSVSLHFPESPASHLGQKVKDSSIEALSKIYVDYLLRVVEAAKKEFN
ncbi:MAG: hypothetical protein KAW19_10560 [Candidatus Aminicenantes bacterium]|nr:hypothetical protein [Candidatus Aminicenantes bacterium]